MSRSRGPMSLQTSELDAEASASKERDIIHSHRLKLAEYIHDVTLLFPHMKERNVFTTDDCDIIANEVPSTLKVDKFVDVLLTKGPKAIDVFHESLDAQYPAMFDYLSRLLTTAGVQLPKSRQLKDREAESGPRSSPIGDSRRPGTFQRHGSKTVRKSLEVLSRQFEVVQQERGALQEQLIKREQEIGSLLSSRESSHRDLLQVTQKYQQMLSELVDWRRILSNQSEGGNQKFQELLAEREQVQLEYDELEGEFMLVSSELSAARDRISRLRSHLERSEQVHALEKEKLKDKMDRQITHLHRQMQRLSRKLEQHGIAGKVAGSNGEGEVPAEDMNSKLQHELEQSLEECSDLTERLDVAHIERKDAIVEKDEIVLKYHAERERRRRAEKELRNNHRRRYQDSPVFPPTTPTFPSNYNIRVEELTVNIPVYTAEGHGMVLDRGVIVTDLVENGLALVHGVRQGDEIRQVNNINLCSDRDPLEFASRLLDYAAQNITLTIRRQMPVSYRYLQATPTSSISTPTSSLLFNPLDPQVSARRASAEHPGFLPLTPGPLGLLRPFSVPASIPHKGNRFSSAYTEKSRDPSHDDQTTSSEGRVPSVSEESGGGDSSEPGSASDSDRLGVLVPRGLPLSIPIPSRLSQDSEGSGLYCTSPGACACNRDSMELPDYITVRPTIMSNCHVLPEPHSFILHDEENRKEEGSEDDVCPLQPPEDSGTPNSGTDDSIKSYPGHGSRWPWQPKAGDIKIMESDQTVNRQLSEPEQRINGRVRDQPRLYGEFESEDEAHHLHRSPVIRRAIRRHRVKKEDKEKRFSQSMGDINQFMVDDHEVILSPVVSQPPGDGKGPEVRRVLLPQGQLGAKLHLIGGRGIGIFIHSERKNSEDGLHSGDQLTMVDSKSVENMTYAEVHELLDSYSLKRQQCIIAVQQNKEGYCQVHKDMRDNFYVRAKYSHTKKEGLHNELLFNKGDILHVVDTLPAKGKGAWRVNKLNCKGNVVESGLVPTKLSATELLLEGQTASSSLPRFLHSFSPKVGKRNGALTLDPKARKMSASLGFRLFEPIRKVKVRDPRPVVLLGALEVDVRRYLVDHGSTTDIKFSYCKRDPLDQLEHVNENEYVEMTTVDGQEMRSTTKHVQELARQGYHCVLCVQRPGELDRPIMALFCPIVVLLDTNHTRVVNKIRSSVHIPDSRLDNPQLHVERVKEVKKYMHTITGKVELSTSMTMWDVVTTVRSLVQQQQESAVWEIEESADV